MVLTTVTEPVQRVDPRNRLNGCAHLIAKAGCNRIEMNLRGIQGHVGTHR